MEDLVIYSILFGIGFSITLYNYKTHQDNEKINKIIREYTVLDKNYNVPV